jgi:acyl-CoA synthetase (AMP-forming)/AMP-acid ligase II
MGIIRHDRIAVVLPNGPEMAVAILTVAANAACAPINPAYRTEELERYFAHLRPRALIHQAGIDPPARRVALSRSVPVIELSAALDAEAGLFTLTGDQASPASDETVSRDHVALLLLTSGTTSRPKIVPLTHANICSSAYNSVAALALRQNDRGINMLPLFHGHGLNNNVLASLAAGASVVCCPGYDVSTFFEWLTAFRPTWFSAVPTMHRAILAQALHDRERAADYRLRFVRSASAPLPPRIFAELEQTFETSVIESYVVPRLFNLRIDYRECMALQSLQLLLRLDCFQFCQHLWRSENARRHPIDRPLCGNEFALCGGMGETPTHGVCAARLIKANMSHDIICVPEVHKHEPALCHARPQPDQNSG